MKARQKFVLPVRLEGTRRRFEGWRRTRKGLSRIPYAMWASAVKAAEKYGLYRTAQTLRLDYCSLKKRVEAAASGRMSAGKTKAAAALSISRRAVSSTLSKGDVRQASHGLPGEEVEAVASRSVSGEDAAATFFELTPPGPACPFECILELENSGGAKMRVHLKGGEVPDLTALCRSFWRGEAS